MSRYLYKEEVLNGPGGQYIQGNQGTISRLSASGLIQSRVVQITEQKPGKAPETRTVTRHFLTSRARELTLPYPIPEPTYVNKDGTRRWSFGTFYVGSSKDTTKGSK